MARASKSVRRPLKNKPNMASQFQNISPKKLYESSVEAHCAKGLVSVGQTFMRGDNVTVVTSHYRSL